MVQSLESGRVSGLTEGLVVRKAHRLCGEQRLLYAKLKSRVNVVFTPRFPWGWTRIGLDPAGYLEGLRRSRG